MTLDLAAIAKQISAAGLEVETVFDRNAERLLPPYLTPDPWVFSWCRRTA